MPFSVERGPCFLNAPLAVVALDLSVKSRRIAHALQVVFHPLKQVLTPVPSRHVLNCFTAVARSLGVVFGPLVRVVVFPLPQHATDLVTLVDVRLVPVRARRSAEDLVGVNVPVLHPLHPVDAPVVRPEGLVDVASFVIVVVHVRIEFAQSVPSGPCKEPFDDIPAHVVEVVAVVIEDGPAVIRVHNLAARLGAAVLVEQRAKGGRTGNGNDGLQVFTALSGRFPRGGALVGLAVNGDVAVAPILRPQPLHRFVDALTFPVTTVVETTRAFLGGEHRHLSEGIAVRNEIVVDEFAAPRTNHVGRAGLAPGGAVVEVRADHGDDRHLLAVFRVGREPIREVDLSGVGTTFPGSGRVHLDERLLNR